MDKFGYLILICCFYFGSTIIIIKEESHPKSIEFGTTDYVILNCDFETDDSGIVVKWFYNGLEDQIYQWIPFETKKPFASGSKKDYIDEEYRASDDNFTMYSALRLKNITTELTGNYTCKLSSDFNETNLDIQLVIYSPPTSFNLTLEDGELAVCNVSQVFPAPEIDLFISEQNLTNGTATIIEYFDDETGLYDITAQLPYNPDFLKTPIKFICDLRIPGTNYSLTETEVFGENSIENTVDEEEEYILNLETASKSEEKPNTTEGDSGMVPMGYSFFSIFMLALAVNYLSV